MIKKTVVLNIFAALSTLVALGQNKPLRVIEPTVDKFPLTLDGDKLKKELREAEQVNSSKLNKRQKDILEWAEWYGGVSETIDPYSIETVGDSWWNCASIDSTFATSTLQTANGIDYKAKNANDWLLKTAWIEGAKGYGIGESITCRFYKDTPPITTVIVYNGYMKSHEAWFDNSRVKQLKLYINGQPYALLNLRDTYRAQHFDIGSHPGSSALLQFEITDIYKGDKYDDVAISEIDFYGTGCLCLAKGTMISTPSGEKSIEQIVPGDKVLSLNMQTNRIEEATVIALANREHHLYELDFGSVKIETTADHPFYFDGRYYSIEKNSTYGVESQQLTIGQSICYLNGDRMETAVLKNITKLDRHETTYTITKLDKNRLFFANGLCVSTESME